MYLHTADTDATYICIRTFVYFFSFSLKLCDICMEIFNGGNNNNNKKNRRNVYTVAMESKWFKHKHACTHARIHISCELKTSCYSNVFKRIHIRFSSMCIMQMAKQHLHFKLWQIAQIIFIHSVIRIAKNLLFHLEHHFYSIIIRTHTNAPFAKDFFSF